MLRYFLLFASFLLAHGILAQIASEPQLPVASKAVTITFNSAEESRLGYYTGDLYAHTGLTIEGKQDWQYVIGNWGENNKQPKLTHKGNGIYELIISPDIKSFYGVSGNDQITSMNFVFRSADNGKQTDDLFVTVYPEGLQIQITAPESNSIVQESDTVNIVANASVAASLKLYINDLLLRETEGTSISSEYIFPASGNYWLIAEATTDSTVRDSVNLTVKPDEIETPKPIAYKNGINYTSDNSAALVLWAPLKEFVYVIGDFNNWQVSNDYLMKKDGDYFWLDITKLDKGKEYAFQYLIDGTLKIADPYTEKILDPLNDNYISEETYPNLISYPENKTEGIVSVLQPGQENYEWEASEFEIPEKEKMVIYELLIRDFTEEHTYASIIESLDYLEDLKVNVLELMPVNEFEGNSSWGYNPSFYFAPDKYYGPKNELKRLIDECHKRGIAVVIDMVLNHSYNQCPFAQMYWNNAKNQPAADNPWFNETSPNTDYAWGNDFNHESFSTQALIDSVNAFWMAEYKVDGFRFDFTKGFTNTPGNGWDYDQSRINILKRMASEIWKRNENALVILEHLTGNTEETILANEGMFLWGNMNHDYTEAAMGYPSNFNWGLHTSRGWNDPNLISYMESHDEERTIYKCLNYGKSDGDYNTKDLNTALNRAELNAVFYIPLPGPKMIWQFGELGYDYSINTCENGSINNDCRTSPKPIPWDYLENTNRTDLFKVMSKLNELKQGYEEFNPDEAEYSLNGTNKWYILSHGDKHVIGLGNFDVKESNVEVTFPAIGTYYEFFTQDSIEITNSTQSFSFAAGEYRLYSSRQFENPDIPTGIMPNKGVSSDISIYPNPAYDWLNITSEKLISKVELYSLTGELLVRKHPFSNNVKLNIEELTPGIYLSKIYQNDTSFSKKLIVN